MNNTSKKEDADNFGPAATTMTIDEKGLEVGFGILMTGKDVQEFKLDITQPEEHTCVIDGDKAYRECRINEFGEIIRQEVNIDQMKKICETRKAQGKEVKTVAKSKGASR